MMIGTKRIPHLHQSERSAMAVLCSTDYPVNPEDHNLTHKVFQRLVRYQLAKQYCGDQGQYDGPRYLPASDKIALVYKNHLLT